MYVVNGPEAYAAPEVCIALCCSVLNWCAVRLRRACREGSMMALCIGRVGNIHTCTHAQYLTHITPSITIRLVPIICRWTRRCSLSTGSSAPLPGHGGSGATGPRRPRRLVGVVVGGARGKRRGTKAVGASRGGWGRTLWTMRSKQRRWRRWPRRRTGAYVFGLCMPLCASAYQDTAPRPLMHAIAIVPPHTKT